MRPTQYLLATGLALLLCACGGTPKSSALDVDASLRYCEQQVQRTLNRLGTPSIMPRSIAQGANQWRLVPINISEWTVGFWPGILWYTYENTPSNTLKAYAIQYTDLLQPLTTLPAYDHDLGFQLFCSYGNAYRLTGRAAYKQILLNAADTLATLFNPKVGTLLSWPREVKPRQWPHNTIIDNMINLELLYWAAKNGGSHHVYDIATRHAETTMQHHFRPDGGCYHVAVYDTVTGQFIKGVTHQGYADNSLWARGQAWAIYGYTMVYRETKDKRFLRFAEKVTDLYLNRLPDGDVIPYWDFDAPDRPKAPKDAAAAAIVASALLELSRLEDTTEKAATYLDAAVTMLAALSSSDYQSRASNPAFLMHATGHWPGKSEIDASIIYADYYYIEALTRYKKWFQSLGKETID